MKYLRKFASEAEYNAFKGSDDYVTPNVVLVNGKVLYNAVEGVFIQHIDGNLYTADAWTAGGFANDQANGVAVKKGAVKFVIAKNDLSSSAYWSSDGSSAVDGVMMTEDSEIAKTDYAGFANTEKIVANSVSGAAFACTKTTFPNGAKGYLPSLGEWATLLSYISDINAALSAIGGQSFAVSTYHWSSTQCKANTAWRINMKDGSVSSFAKNNGFGDTLKVRPFTTLK